MLDKLQLAFSSQIRRVTNTCGEMLSKNKLLSVSLKPNDTITDNWWQIYGRPLRVQWLCSFTCVKSIYRYLFLSVLWTRSWPVQVTCSWPSLQSLWTYNYNTTKTSLNLNSRAETWKFKNTGMVLQICLELLLLPAAPCFLELRESERVIFHGFAGQRGSHWIWPAGLLCDGKAMGTEL